MGAPPPPAAGLPPLVPQRLDPVTIPFSMKAGRRQHVTPDKTQGTNHPGMGRRGACRVPAAARRCHQPSPTLAWRVSCRSEQACALLSIGLAGMLLYITSHHISGRSANATCERAARGENLGNLYSSPLAAHPLYQQAFAPRPWTAGAPGGPRRAHQSTGRGSPAAQPVSRSSTGWPRSCRATSATG